MRRLSNAAFEKRLDRLNFIKPRNFFRAAKSERGYFGEPCSYEVHIHVVVLEEAFGNPARFTSRWHQWDFVSEDGAGGFVLVADLSSKKEHDEVRVFAYVPYGALSDDCSDKEFDRWFEFPMWVQDRTLRIEIGEQVPAI